MIVYSPADLANIEADLIIETGTDIYLCWCSRESGAPDITANTWKIKKIEMSTTTVDDVSVTETKILYPYGRKTFEFSPNDINDYEFIFAK